MSEHNENDRPPEASEVVPGSTWNVEGGWRVVPGSTWEVAEGGWHMPANPVTIIGPMLGSTETFKCDDAKGCRWTVGRDTLRALRPKPDPVATLRPNGSANAAPPPDEAWLARYRDQSLSASGWVAVCGTMTRAGRCMLGRAHRREHFAPSAGVVEFAREADVANLSVRGAVGQIVAIDEVTAHHDVGRYFVPGDKVAVGGVPKGEISWHGYQRSPGDVEIVTTEQVSPPDETPEQKRQRDEIVARWMEPHDRDHAERVAANVRESLRQRRVQQANITSQTSGVLACRFGRGE